MVCGTPGRLAISGAVRPRVDGRLQMGSVGGRPAGQLPRPSVCLSERRVCRYAAVFREGRVLVGGGGGVQQTEALTSGDFTCA